jgi:hypothetical protein
MQSGPTGSLLVRDRCGALEPRIAILSGSEQRFEAGLAEMGVSGERVRDSAVFHHAKAQTIDETSAAINQPVDILVCHGTADCLGHFIHVIDRIVLAK